MVPLQRPQLVDEEQIAPPPRPPPVASAAVTPGVVLGVPGGNALAAIAKSTPIGRVPVDHPLDSIVDGNELLAANDREDRTKVLEILRATPFRATCTR